MSGMSAILNIIFMSMLFLAALAGFAYIYASFAALITETIEDRKEYLRLKELREKQNRKS